MRNTIIRCLFTATAMLGFNAVKAQTINPDSVYLSKAYENAVSSFRTEHAPLFNGKLYSSPVFNPHYGHPFYASNEWYTGTIIYDGVKYNNVPLLYDMVLDEVLTKHISNPAPISLVKEKVNRFTLHNHTYVYVKTDSASNPEMPAGFYDLLYDGEVSVLARRQKKARSVSSSSTVLKTRFKSSDLYFIKKGGTYHTVKSQKDILKMFSDRKAEMDQFMSQNKISFKKDAEEALTKIAAYYSKAGN